MSAPLLTGGLSIIAAGGLGALLAGRRSALVSWWAAGCTLLGSLLGLGQALTVLRSGAPAGARFPWAVPGGEFVLVIDPLSAVFLLPLFVLAPLCALYGVGYLAEEGQRRRLGAHWFFYSALVVAMALVLTAANALLFLAVWELMSLTSFFLVAFDHRQPQVGRAAWVYLLACHLGGACLFGLFLLAGRFCDSLEFADFVRLGGAGSALSLGLFLLALVGFGTKAGLFPLHVWLPDAHPAAPSHVSALMSGVMVKTGVYGILRLLTLLPTPPAWWGLLLAGLGILGALYGIALAALQTDIKRSLAYSTVENVGIIFLGLGLGVYATARQLPAVAALGFLGALLHVWNHALFKGLLFLGAGSLLHGTGTRDLSRMGGLLRRMPMTGGLLVAGSLAITALPPLNGLVGEWLIYLGLLRAGTLDSGVAGLAPLLLAALLAVTGALAVVVFTRLVGVTLLGEPRSAGADKAHESPGVMILPMQLLFLGCLGIGLAPQVAGRHLAPAVAPLLKASPALAPATVASLAGLGVAALVVVGVTGLAVLLLVGVRRLRPVARAGTWGCGFAFPSARMAYTAGGYAELTEEHLLPAPLRPEDRTVVVQGLFPAAGRLARSLADPVLSRIFAPLFARLADRAQRLRWLQQGRLPFYLLYIFAACALLIAWSVLEGRGWRIG